MILRGVVAQFDKPSGDGLIEQTTRQFHDANPRDEDLAWATASFEEFLAFRR